MRIKVSLALIVLTFVLANGNHASTVAQEPEIICPLIEVECPTDVAKRGDLVFRAHVTLVNDDTKVGYRWIVRSSRGVRKPRITSGQGTPSITVAASPAARRGLTVTVTVMGILKVCRNQASCSVGIPAR